MPTVSPQEFANLLPDSNLLASDEPEMESSLHYLQAMLLVSCPSYGCVTVPIANALKWREIEKKIPEGDPGQVVGSMQVIDSRPEVGNSINPRAGGFER
jgi:hypothetical protein